MVSAVMKTLTASLASQDLQRMPCCYCYQTGSRARLPTPSLQCRPMPVLAMPYAWRRGKGNGKEKEDREEDRVLVRVLVWVQALFGVNNCTSESEVYTRNEPNQYLQTHARWREGKWEKRRRDVAIEGRLT